MSAHHRPVRALFQPTDPCQRCHDASRRAIRCACGQIYCDLCLREVINEWVMLQDQTNPSSTLMSPSDLGDAYDDLPTFMINHIRYKSLSTRVTECSTCLQRTICPPCSIFSYYQRCELCKFSNVCPKCVSEEALVGFPGVPHPEMINPFLKRFWQPEEGIGVVPITSSASTSCEVKSMLLWRCRLHLLVKLQEEGI